MISFRPVIQASIACLSALVLAGCIFDNPLSEVSSANINTRLLGVFEHTEIPEKEGDPPIIHRVAVLPLTEDRYVIYYRNVTKQPGKIWEFVAWQARVDNDFYLNVRDVTDGSPTFGKFFFFGFDWRFPSAVNLRQIDLEGFEAATPYQLRMAVRQKRKDEALFPFDAVQWHMIARIYWDRSTNDPFATIPPEFEKGPLVSNPGF